MTQDEIYIGSDSKVPTTLYYHDNNNLIITNTVSYECKTFKTGKIFLTGAGKKVKQVSEVLSRSYNPKDSISKIVQTFITAAIKNLTDTLYSIRKNMPSQYKSFIDSLYISDIAICGFENNKPVMYRMQFDMDCKLEDKIIKIKCNSRLVSLKHINDTVTSALGHTDCVIIPKYVPNKDFGEDIKSIIEKQIECSPKSVGKPISVLRIRSDNTHLIYPGLCKF